MKKILNILTLSLLLTSSVFSNECKKCKFGDSFWEYVSEITKKDCEYIKPLRESLSSANPYNYLCYVRNKYSSNDGQIIADAWKEKFKKLTDAAKNNKKNEFMKTLSSVYKDFSEVEYTFDLFREAGESFNIEIIQIIDNRYLIFYSYIESNVLKDDVFFVENLNQPDEPADASNLIIKSDDSVIIMTLKGMLMADEMFDCKIYKKAFDSIICE